MNAYSIFARGSAGSNGAVGLAAPLVGGDAVLVVDSQLTIEPDTLLGGVGGSLAVAGCLQAASGGAGLRVVSTGQGPTSVVDVVGGTILAGDSCAFAIGCGVAPGTTLDVVNTLGTLTMSNEDQRTLFSPIYGEAGTPLYSFGPQGEQVFFFVSFSSGPPLTLPGIGGTILIDPSSNFLLGTDVTTPSQFGSFAQLILPSFPSLGFQLTAYFQALHLTPAGGLNLSSPRSSPLK